MVVANYNRLDTRKTTVTLVTVDSEKKVQLTQDEVAEGIEIEERIVNAVVVKHKSSHLSCLSIARLCACLLFHYSCDDSAYFHQFMLTMSTGMKFHASRTSILLDPQPMYTALLLL